MKSINNGKVNSIMMNNIWKWIKRILFILAALWAIWASFNIIFVPMTTQEVVVISANGSQTEEKTTSQVSWYEAQGWWGIVIVVTFAFMYSIVGSLAYFDYLPGLAISSLFSIFLTLLAALSIGGAYAPSLLGVILGWLVLGIEKLLSRKPNGQKSSDESSTLEKEKSI